MSADELKSALVNRDFTRVQSLISEWGEGVACALQNAAGERERRLILDNARAFGEQHLYLAQVVRAHIATELQANSASFLYSHTDLEQPRWRLRA